MAGNKGYLITPVRPILLKQVNSSLFIYNGTTRQHMNNNVWEAITGTTISFITTAQFYTIDCTFTHRYDRGGFWQILLNRVNGTNLKTITPGSWLTDYNEGAVFATSRWVTRQQQSVIEVVPNTRVSVWLETNNSNTSNYISYAYTLVTARRLDV